MKSLSLPQVTTDKTRVYVIITPVKSFNCTADLHTSPPRCKRTGSCFKFAGSLHSESLFFITFTYREKFSLDS